MRFAAFGLVTLLAGSASAQELIVGGSGESCRARSDCQEGLACIRETCTNPNAPHSSAPSPSLEGDQPKSDWIQFRLEGIHGFVGLTWATGPVVLGLSGNTKSGFNKADGGFLFALRGGAFIGRSQLTFEVSPFSYLYDHRAQGPAFQMNGSYAYFIPLKTTGNVLLHWPMRVGVGMMAGGDNTEARAYFQARADLVGLAVQIGHVMLEFHAPSFRYFATDYRGTQGHILTWLLGLDASYVF
jgi:hypothetical protein